MWCGALLRLNLKWVWPERLAPEGEFPAITHLGDTRAAPLPPNDAAPPRESQLMKLAHILLSGLILAAATQAPPPAARSPMPLGNFSVSLTVRDIGAAKAFYEKLGFVQIGGDPAQRWVIMKNGSTNIGLFQGMFPRNALTFNPGWDQDGSPTGAFEDVRSHPAAAAGGRPRRRRADRQRQRPGKLHPDRPGRQPDPVRPASLARRGPWMKSSPRT